MGSPEYTLKGKRVWIAGHRGMAGSAILRRLASEDCDCLTATSSELDLRRHKGSIPIEMFGGNIFPRVGDLPYLLTLGPYQFYWFRLRRI